MALHGTTKRFLRTPQACQAARSRIRAARGEALTAGDDSERDRHRTGCATLRRAAINSISRAGVTGNVSIAMSNGASASSIAETIAAAAGIAPPSPAPL